MELYEFLAKSVAGIHWIMIALIWGGTVVCLFSEGYIVRHTVVVGTVFIVQVIVYEGDCPLTLLEQWLLSNCESCVNYTGSFLVDRISGMTDSHVQMSLYVIGGLTAVRLSWLIWKKTRKNT